MESAPASGAPRLARREARLLAAAIDLAAAAAIGLAALLAAAALMLLQVNPIERDPSGGEWLAGYAALALWIPAVAAYIGFATARGGTLGARLAGLRVTGGGRRAAWRALLWWPGAAAGIALWWPWIDGEGRALVDRLTGTLVIEGGVD